MSGSRSSPSRVRVLAAGLAVLLAGGTLVATVTPAVADPAPPALPTATRLAAGRYLSAPPSPAALAGAKTEERRPAAQATPPPTRGLVTGRALDPTGHPLSGAVVRALTYDELGSRVDFSLVDPLTTTTDADGRFSFPQYTERYLIEVCSSAAEQPVCSDAIEDRTFSQTWVGPDGVTDSWLRQTRLFTPIPSGRSLGTFRVKPQALLAGVYADGPYRRVRLVRGDGSLAALTYTDENARFAFSVAPGRYRVETERDEGLQTFATVPGASVPVTLRAGRPTSITLRNTDATLLSGQVLGDGAPAADVLLVVLDGKGRFAAGVVTDAEGRYVFHSLKPGRYTIGSTHVSGRYVPQTQVVHLSRRTPAQADFRLTTGGTISFTPVDVPDAIIGADLRDAAGRVVKSFPTYQGSEEDGSIRFTGLAPGRYQLVAKRLVDPFSDDTSPQRPWTQRTVVVGRDARVELGAVALDQPTLVLTGRLPAPRTRVQFGSLPADDFLRDELTVGNQPTNLTVEWTSNDDDGTGTYRAVGVVPGTYVAMVGTAFLEPDDQLSTFGADVATTLHRITLGTTSAVIDFSAPRGAVVTGRLQDARTGRPLVAPVGVRVRDTGPEGWIFPNVSDVRGYGQGFVVRRLHTGPIRLGLFDLDAFLELSDRRIAVVIGQVGGQAPIAEPGTPYWLSARPRHGWVRSGRVTDLGAVDVEVRGC